MAQKQLSSNAVNHHFILLCGSDKFVFEVFCFKALFSCNSNRKLSHFVANCRVPSQTIANRRATKG